jgi:PPK2 family polyphosphate:nucleotide phosphotransferase
VTSHDELRVEPGKPAGLADRDPKGTLDLKDKDEGKKRLDEAEKAIEALQLRLWAESKRGFLLVLQGMDGSGKDAVISHVLAKANPQGCRVASFKAPTETELAHDYLWRVHTVAPARGELTIFNRSHYEDVVAVRVLGLAPEEVWSHRFRHIAEFERMLTDEGFHILKIFLHLSRDGQRKELQQRIDDPEKRWKFRKADLDVRAHWDDYQAAWEEAITKTSTDYAPWHVVPADRNWARNTIAAELVARELKQLDPQFPPGEPGIESIVVS